MMQRQLPKVTFIIPTLNASAVLSRCLTAIRAQDYPEDKIEIIISDGGSTDNTISIAGNYKTKIIHNPEVLHEPGKTLASKYATGNILFFTDADNILSHKNWVRLMVAPYMDNERVLGFLPQTIPAPDTNILDKYLGYLCTDPFTWFIYQDGTSGRDYDKMYKPVTKGKSYSVFKFPKNNLPLFGLSQGVGINKKFDRGGIGRSDDILAGIKLMLEGGLVAYIPDAGVYHYHVSGLSNYLKKYSWRAKNNLSQQIKGMGITNRTKFLSFTQRWRMYAYIPYAFSLIFPSIDAVKLLYKHRDPVLLLHPLITLVTAFIILYSYCRYSIIKTSKLQTYE